jgi:predicted dehydrogenase
MSRLTVGVLGCGRMGHKRAEALSPGARLIGCFDVDPAATDALADTHGARGCRDVEELLSLRPDAVIVATSHDQLAPLTERALAAGSHVLVEKPAGLSAAEIERLIGAASAAGRLVKVGFNHRFHPALSRAAAEVQSGEHGELMHLRGRYGHGGRPGYNLEWRAQPRRSGGGELVDQGMHLLDLSHWLAGPLPLHSALLRTHFWEGEVEDNAALILGSPEDRVGPWAMLHVTWTEWKNTFSLEIYCRTAKLQVDGLVRSYGPQRLRIYRMKPELGPPDMEEIRFPDEDVTWTAEWKSFVAAIRDGAALTGGLTDALYAWRRVEDAYADGPYAGMRSQVTGATAASGHSR